MKLVGNFRATVVEASIGLSKKNKPIAKVVFDVTDELINDQWMSLPVSQKIPFFYSLDKDFFIPKINKSSAQLSAEMIKESYDYSGPVSEISKIVFTPVELVCEDHNDGAFTRIKYVNNPNRVKAELKAFKDDYLSELDKIFKAVAA